MAHFIQTATEKIEITGIKYLGENDQAIVQTIVSVLESQSPEAEIESINFEYGDGDEFGTAVDGNIAINLSRIAEELGDYDEATLSLLSKATLLFVETVVHELIHALWPSFNEELTKEVVTQNINLLYETWKIPQTDGTLKDEVNDIIKSLPADHILRVTAQAGTDTVNGMSLREHIKATNAPDEEWPETDALNDLINNIIIEEKGENQMKEEIQNTAQNADFQPPNQPADPNAGQMPMQGQGFQPPNQPADPNAGQMPMQGQGFQPPNQPADPNAGQIPMQGQGFQPPNQPPNQPADPNAGQMPMQGQGYQPPNQPPNQPADPNAGQMPMQGQGYQPPMPGQGFQPPIGELNIAPRQPTTSVAGGTNPQKFGVGDIAYQGHSIDIRTVNAVTEAIALMAWDHIFVHCEWDLGLLKYDTNMRQYVGLCLHKPQNIGLKVPLYEMRRIHSQWYFILRSYQIPLNYRVEGENSNDGFEPIVKPNGEAYYRGYQTQGGGWPLIKFGLDEGDGIMCQISMWPQQPFHKYNNPSENTARNVDVALNNNDKMMWVRYQKGGDQNNSNLIMLVRDYGSGRPQIERFKNTGIRSGQNPATRTAAPAYNQGGWQQQQNANNQIVNQETGYPTFG